MDTVEEEEYHHRNPFVGSAIYNNSLSIARPQFRKEVSKARWDEKMRMGEIIEKKGGIWATTGVIRNGDKLYCSIEEIMFFAERGALHLLDYSNTILTMKQIHEKTAEVINGCSWESFEVYKRLKSLGYIIGRHRVAWTLKRDKRHSDSDYSLQMEISKISDKSCSGLEDAESITGYFEDMQINDIKPIYDVYLPDSKFKKSSPGIPFFVLCLVRGNPPSRLQVEKLERDCNGLPLKFCHVDHWLESGQPLITTYE